MNTHSNRPTGRIVAAIIATLLLFVACEENGPLRLRYEAEKALYNADRMNERLMIRPDLVTESQSDSLIDRYVTTLRGALTAMDSVDRQANSMIWADLRKVAFISADRSRSLALRRGLYKTALQISNEILNRGELAGAEALIMRLTRGRAAMATGELETARNEFLSIVDDYNPPLDPQGGVLQSVLNLPYDLYMFEKKKLSAKETFHRADTVEQYYLEQSKHANPDLRIASNALLAVFYQVEDRPLDAIKTLKLVVDSTGQQMLAAKIRAWNIRINEFGEYRPVLTEIQRDFEQTSDTLIRPVYLFKMAECYLGMRKFDSSRTALYRIKNEYTSYFYSNPLAQLLIAKTFETEGKWDRAENEYRWLVETFPTSDVSFRAFLDILDYLTKANDTRNLQSWKDRALQFYQTTLQRYPNTSLEAAALSHIADVYRRFKQWPDCAAALRRLAENFSESTIGRQAALSAYVAYRQNIGDTAASDSMLKIYESGFSHEEPDFGFSPSELSVPQ